MTVYVVDQNMMQHPTLEVLLINEPHARFVIPDVAFVEMSKREDWEYTMRLAFEKITPAVERTFLSLAVGEALSIEVGRGSAIDPPALLPDDFKVFVQSLMLELAENREGPSKTIIRERFKSVRADLLMHELNHESAKHGVAKLVDPWVQGVKPTVLKAMRNGTYDDKFILSFIKFNADVMFPQYAKAAGMSEDECEALTGTKSMSLRYFYLLVRHSLSWAISGSWEQVRADKELNNQLDLEYALIASFFDNLLTLDTRARKAYEDLLAMLAMTTEEAEANVKAVLMPSAQVEAS